MIISLFPNLQFNTVHLNDDHNMDLMMHSKTQILDGMDCVRKDKLPEEKKNKPSFCVRLKLESFPQFDL